MMARRTWLVACAATAMVACVEPAAVERFSPDECTVLYSGPGGYDDGLVGICHAGDNGYEYIRVSPVACREAHRFHELDFRSDDPTCHLLPERVASREPVVDTMH